MLRILASGALRLVRGRVVDRASPGRPVDAGLLDECVHEAPTGVPGDGRNRQREELRGAERVAWREREGEAERQDLERGSPARTLAPADGREGVARERGLERAGVAAREERRGPELSRAGVGSRQLRDLEWRVGLEDEDLFVPGEGRPRLASSGGQERALEPAEVGGLGGDRRLGVDALDGRALRRERVDDAQEHGVERAVRRTEPDRERLGQRGRAVDLEEQRREHVGEAGRHRPEPGGSQLLGRGEVREPGRAFEVRSIPLRCAEPVTQPEQERGDAPRVLRPRAGEGARAVLEQRETRGVSGDALGMRSRLAAQSEEPAEPLREAERPDALPAGASFVRRELVAPGGSAVGRGEEEIEQWALARKRKETSYGGGGHDAEGPRPGRAREVVPRPSGLHDRNIDDGRAILRPHVIDGVALDS